MTYTAAMIDAYPARVNLDRDRLVRAIDALAACAQACSACADACLSESADALPNLVRCTRDAMDCASICATTASVLSHQTGYDARLTRAQVLAAAQATKTCGDSCAEHANAHGHCKTCAQACRETEQVLNELLPLLEPTDEAPAAPSRTAPPQ